jgi:hypothetical protein
MIWLLILAMFFISCSVGLGAVFFFHHAVDKLLRKILDEELAHAWSKFFKFALCATSISSGLSSYTLSTLLTKEYIDRSLWVIHMYGAFSDALSACIKLIFWFFFASLLLYGVLQALNKPKIRFKPSQKDNS